MSRESQEQKIKDLAGQLTSAGMAAIGSPGSPGFTLDFVLIGATKRCWSLSSAYLLLADASNIVVCRAIVRMMLDTVCRVYAYTYVEHPEDVARKILGGEQLRNQKSSDGKNLTDAYLVERFSKEHPWAQSVYDFTSGYVHFSESQIFDSIHSVGSDDDRMVTFAVNDVDSKYPDESWEEMAACIAKLMELLMAALYAYGQYKRAKKPFQPTDDVGG